MNETAIWKYLTSFNESLLYKFNTHTNNNFSPGLDSDTRTWAHSTHDLHYPISPMVQLELCLIYESEA